MNTNPSGLDPSARSFTGQYSQLQNQGNVYQMGSNLTGLQHLQGGLQSQLGARAQFGGMPVSSSQPGERFQAGFTQQLNQYQQAQSRHPGLTLGNYGSQSSARNQFGATQLALQSQGLGNRPLMNASMTGLQGFGGVSQNPQGIQGIPMWQASGQQQSNAQSNLHSLSTMNRMQGLNPQQQQLAQVRSMNTLGQNISREVATEGWGGLLQQPQQQPQQQQQQNPNPSQDLLSIMKYGNRGQQPQQQNPYGLMSRVPNLQATSAGGTFGGGRSALPFERPGEQGLAASSMNGLRLDTNEFPSLSGVTATSAIGTRPATLALSMSLDVEADKSTKEEYPALPALDSQSLKASLHGPIGRNQVFNTISAPIQMEPSADAPSSAAQTYFHASHNMPASIQDSLKNIQAGRVLRSPPPAARAAPSTPPKNSASLLLQPPQQLNTSCDRFSLLGLNSVIRKVDEDLSMLALGQDLTQLGLKLDDPANKLHKTFVSPFADHQAPEDTPDFEIPASYKVHPPHSPPLDCTFVQNPPEKLCAEHLAKFKDETLFYMFYASPGEEAQALASATLIHRGLTWHKDHKQWFMRVPNMNPQKSPDGERGSYIFFDTTQWKYIQKDNFLVKYEAVETAPMPLAAK